jgi:hypothetical protein
MSAEVSADPPEEGNPSAKPPGTGQAGPPAPAEPPAATTVAKGAKSERDIELEGELEKERQAHATTAAEKKAREQRVNELEDELRRLKEVPKPTPPPPPTPKKPSRIRLTFFDPPAD